MPPTLLSSPRQGNEWQCGLESLSRNTKLGTTIPKPWQISWQKFIYFLFLSPTVFQTCWSCCHWCSLARGWTCTCWFRPYTSTCKSQNPSNPTMHSLSLQPQSIFCCIINYQPKNIVAIFSPCTIFGEILLAVKTKSSLYNYWESRNDIKCDCSFKKRKWQKTEVNVRNCSWFWWFKTSVLSR